MTEMGEDIAWAAGLFEGEGTLCIINKKKRTDKGIRASVYSTDLDVLERFKYVVGMGRVHKGKMREHQTKTPYIWTIANKRDVGLLISLLYPWLGERRKAKADELRLYLDDGRVTRGPALRNKQRIEAMNQEWPEDD